MPFRSRILGKCWYKPCAIGSILLSCLMLWHLAQAQSAPLSAMEPFVIGTCSGSFIAHDLDHVTRVPGGDTVRAFEANGAGVAIHDLDNDGDLDIVLANHAGANAIFFNEGGLQFRRKALGEGDARAVTIVDLNADGWQDIIFSRRVSAPNYWLNQGDGSFSLEFLPGIDKPLYAINWADLDADGDLDLVGASYDAALLNEFGQEFLESGKAGVYVYTNEAGRFLEARLASEAQALALVLIDIDSDGRLDILVGNDFAVPDVVWLNTTAGWERAEPFAATTHSTMSFDSGDINNDGQAELFASDMKPYPGEAEEPWLPLLEAMMQAHPEGDPQVMENVLQFASEEGFVNQAAQSGIDGTGWSWSGKFGDLDQDGFLDLYVVNGMMEEKIFAHLEYHELVEANQAFRNDGQGNFVAMPSWNLASLLSGRGMSMADLDNDGDLDIVVNNLRAQAQLFENQLCTGNSVQVDLFWHSANTRALGAKLALLTDKGTFYRDSRAASGYLSGDAARIHFGVPAGAVLKRLEITWPDGFVSVLKDLSVNRLIRVIRED